jgi:hypothetical protein
MGRGNRPKENMNITRTVSPESLSRWQTIKGRLQPERSEKAAPAVLKISENRLASMADGMFLMQGVHLVPYDRHNIDQDRFLDVVDLVSAQITARIKETDDIDFQIIRGTIFWSPEASHTQIFFHDPAVHDAVANALQPWMHKEINQIETLLQFTGDRKDDWGLLLGAHPSLTPDQFSHTMATHNGARDFLCDNLKYFLMYPKEMDSAVGGYSDFRTCCQYLPLKLA